MEKYTVVMIWPTTGDTQVEKGCSEEQVLKFMQIAMPINSSFTIAVVKEKN